MVVLGWGQWGVLGVFWAGGQRGGIWHRLAFSATTSQSVYSMRVGPKPNRKTMLEVRGHKRLALLHSLLWASPYPDMSSHALCPHTQYKIYYLSPGSEI